MATSNLPDDYCAVEADLLEVGDIIESWDDEDHVVTFVSSDSVNTQVSVRKRPSGDKYSVTKLCDEKVRLANV